MFFEKRENKPLNEKKIYLCKHDLKKYHRYEYEIFRIGRTWSEIVPIAFVLRQWCHSLELALPKKVGTYFEILPLVLSPIFLRDGLIICFVICRNDGKKYLEEFPFFAKLVFCRPFPVPRQQACDIEISKTIRT